MKNIEITAVVIIKDDLTSFLNRKLDWHIKMNAIFVNFNQVMQEFIQGRTITNIKKLLCSGSIDRNVQNK